MHNQGGGRQIGRSQKDPSLVDDKPFGVHQPFASVPVYVERGKCGESGKIAGMAGDVHGDAGACFFCQGGEDMEVGQSIRMDMDRSSGSLDSPQSDQAQVTPVMCCIQPDRILPCRHGKMEGVPDETVHSRNNTEKREKEKGDPIRFFGLSHGAL